MSARLSLSAAGGRVAAAMASGEQLEIPRSGSPSEWQQQQQDYDKPTFHVRVGNCRATKIPKRSLFSSAEPYLVFTFDSRTLTTPVSEAATEPAWPHWTESFSYSVDSLALLRERFLTVECYDGKASSDLFIGSASVDLWTLATGPSLHVHVLQEKKPSKRPPKIYFNVDMTLYTPVTIALANVMCIALPPLRSPDTSLRGSHADAWMNDVYLSAYIRSGSSSSGIVAPSKRSYVRFDCFDPLWAEPDLSWVFLTSLRDLLSSTLIIEVYNMNSSLNPTFLGGATVPFSTCYSLDDGVPAIFRSPLCNRSRDLGPLMNNAQIEGQLYFSNLPAVSQMSGGSYSQSVVASAQPLLAALPRPACDTVGDDTPVVQPYDPSRLPPRTSPSPYFRFVDVVPVLHSGIEAIVQQWRRHGVDLLTEKRLEVGGCTLEQRLRYANFDKPLDFSLTRGLGALVCLLRASPKMEIRAEHGLHLMSQCARLLVDVVRQDPIRSQELVRTVGGVAVILGLLSQYRIGSENLSYFCQILDVLSIRDSANQLAIRKAGGIPILVSVLQSSHTRLADKAMVVKILRNLCYLGEPGDEEGSSHVIRYAGGLKVLVELLLVSKHAKKTTLMKVFASAGELATAPEQKHDDHHHHHHQQQQQQHGEDQANDEAAQFELVQETIATLDVLLSSEDNLRSIEPLSKDLLLYGWFPHAQSFCLNQLSRLQALLQRGGQQQQQQQQEQSFSSVIVNIGLAPFLQVIGRSSQSSEAADARLAAEVKDRSLGLLGQILAPGTSAAGLQRIKEIRVDSFLPLLASGEQRIVALAVEILGRMATLRKHAIAMCSHNVVETLLPPLLDLSNAPVSFATVVQMARLLVEISRHEGTGGCFAAVVDHLCYLILNVDSVVVANPLYATVSPADLAALHDHLVELLAHVFPKLTGASEAAAAQFGQALDVCAALYALAAAAPPSRQPQRAQAVALNLVADLCQGFAAHSRLFKQLLVEHATLVASLVDDALQQGRSPSAAAAKQLLQELCAVASSKRGNDLDDRLVAVFQQQLRRRAGQQNWRNRPTATADDQLLIGLLDELDFAVDAASQAVGRKQRSAKSLGLLPSPSDVAAAGHTDEDDERECLVCMDALPDAVFYPCGHMTTCWDCAQDIMASKKPVCPVCRADIEQPIKPYFS